MRFNFLKDKVHENQEKQEQLLAILLETVGEDSLKKVSTKLKTLWPNSASGKQPTKSKADFEKTFKSVFYLS